MPGAQFHCPPVTTCTQAQTERGPGDTGLLPVPASTPTCPAPGPGPGPAHLTGQTRPQWAQEAQQPVGLHRAPLHPALHSAEAQEGSQLQNSVRTQGFQVPPVSPKLASWARGPGQADALCASPPLSQQSVLERHG